MKNISGAWVALATLTAASILPSCEHSPAPTGPSATGEQITLKEELSPVEQLVLKLVNSGYTRGLDQNDYYMSYRAGPKDSIVIILKHPEYGESKKLKEVVESAKGVIQRMAVRNYGIRDLKIEVESTRLSPEEVPARLRAVTSEQPGSH